MIGFKITDALLSRINELLERCEDLSSEEKKKLEEMKVAESLSSTALASLMAINRRLGLGPIKSLLAQSQLVFYDYQEEIKKPSPELLKRRAFLQTRQEERDYNMMMYGKTSNPHVENVVNMGNEMNSLKTQAMISFNMIFALVASGGTGYIVGKQLGFGQPQSLVLALVGAMLMLVVEMVLFIMRATEVEHHLEAPTLSQRQSAQAKRRAGALLTPLDVLPQR